MPDLDRAADAGRRARYLTTRLSWDDLTEADREWHRITIT